MLDSYVYFVQQKDYIGCIKIGVSKKPEDRIKQLSTGSSVDLRTLTILKCPSPKAAFAVEAGLHRCFRFSSTKGEWFTNTKPMRSLVDKIVDGLPWSQVLLEAEKLTEKANNKKATTIASIRGIDGDLKHLEIIKAQRKLKRKLRGLWQQDHGRQKVRGGYTNSGSPNSL